MAAIFSQGREHFRFEDPGRSAFSRLRRLNCSSSELGCAAEEVSLPEFPALCLAERIAGSIFEEFNHHGGKGEIFLKIYFLIYMYE